jgi:hypothetical protein
VKMMAPEGLGRWASCLRDRSQLRQFNVHPKESFLDNWIFLQSRKRMVIT